MAGRPVTELEELARSVLANQPFSRLLGTRLVHIEPGRAELSVVFDPRLTQQHGFLHGGVLAYLADNAITFAGGSMLGESVTAGLTISYVRPVTACDVVVAVATVEHCGRSQAVARCDVSRVESGARTLCAVAQGTVQAARSAG